MIVILGLVTIGLIGCCMIKRKYGKELFTPKDYKFGMGLACWIEDYFNISKRFGMMLWNKIDNISNHECVDTEVKKHYIKKIYYCIIIIFVMNVLGIIYCINDKVNKDSLAVISRPEPGEGSVQVTKKVIIDNEEKDITFDIDERQPSKNEAEEVIISAKEYIDDNFLGENESCEKICQPLNLVDSYGENVEITWITDEEGYIYSDGTVERIKEPEGVIVTISAIISYGDYEEEYIIPLKLVPDENKTKWTNFTDSIEQINKSNLEEKNIVLPEYAGDKKVSYVEEGSNEIWSIFLLGFVAMIGILKAMDNDINNKDKVRREQMLIDFPEVMSKMKIYLQAGLSIQGAWKNMVNEYTKYQEKSQKRFIYEEMKYTYNEVNNGMTFVNAIENFGKRCDIIQYNKFATWLIQSNSKGPNGLIELLESESYEAKEERNKLIQINGEKISQKLLVPMMGLLIIVMVIVMVPAFINMM